MKKEIYLSIVIVIFGGLFLGSCAKIDPMVFKGTAIDEYLLEDYDGVIGFEDLPDSFDIPEQYTTIFTIESQLPSESEATKIYALYVGDMASIATDTIIVYFHGQSYHMDAYWPRTKLIANTGGKNRYGVLTIDYRGYGKSEGSSTEASLYQDAKSALIWLDGQGVNTSNVVIYGYSLGTAPATELLSNHTPFAPAKLILESPMASAQNLAEEASVINVSSDFFSTLDFNTADKMKSINQPLLIMHGELDDYLSISNSEIIFGNYTGTDGTFIRVPGAYHSTPGVPQTMGYVDYLEALETFVTK